MSQRVNIQYSIDIDELPVEIDRLVKDVQGRLNNLSHMDIFENQHDAISLKSISNMNKIRETLGSIDHSLVDITNIMNGYINFMTSSPDNEAEENVPIEHNETELYPATEVKNKFDDLESKLEQFKQNSKQENYDPVATQKSEFSQEVPKTTT